MITITVPGGEKISVTQVQSTMAASTHIRIMLDNDHFNSVPARGVSAFPFNSWPVHQHVSQIEKTCYPKSEDKQVRV